MHYSVQALPGMRTALHGARPQHQHPRTPGPHNPANLSTQQGLGTRLAAVNSTGLGGNCTGTPCHPAAGGKG